MYREVIEDLIKGVLDSREIRESLVELIKNSVYEVNIKKDRDSGEVTITVVLKVPAPAEKMLFLLT